MAQETGLRTTYSAFTTENRVVRQIGPKIALLDPTAAPMITLLNAMKGKRKQTDNPVFEWLEDDFVARWAQSNATVSNTTTANTIALATGHGKYFVPGDVFIVPNADSSSTAPEMCRVTGVSSDTITVTRAFAGTTVQTIGNTSALRIIGQAFGEGAAAATSKNTVVATRTSYTQIFKQTLKLTGTYMSTKQYGDDGDERKRQHAKMLQQVKIDMNGALLFGKATSTTDADGNPLRTTAGLNTVISSNIFDAGGTITLKYLDSFANSAFRFGPKEKYLFTGGAMTRAINAWARNQQISTSREDKVFGVMVKQIETPFGIWNHINDYALESPTSLTAGFSGYGFAGWGFSVDLEEIDYRFMKGRDTRLVQDIERAGYDYKVDELLAEVGFEIRQEKHHAKIYNVTDYAA